jgi:circadian clock protein KaiC
VEIRGGYHDFAIKRGGLEIYPRLVAAEHHASFSRELLSSGVGELDQLLGGGLARGTTTLILGPAGSGKTLVASHFVQRAASNNEHCAVFLFDEGAGTFFAGTSGIGLDISGHVDAGRVMVRQIDPAELGPGEFVSQVRASVEGQGVRVVLIDSLNGYLNSMPEERFLTAHLHELFSYLRQRGDDRHQLSRRFGHPDALLRSRRRLAQGGLRREEARRWPRRHDPGASDIRARAVAERAAHRIPRCAHRRP